MPGVAHERALAAVATPHRALDLGRHVAAAGSWCGYAARPRRSSRRELVLLELGDGQIEYAIEHLGEISGWDLMAQEVLRLAQLLARALLDRDLEPEALRRQRRDPSWCRWGWGFDPSRNG